MLDNLGDDHTDLHDGAQRFAADTFGPARLRSLRDTDDGLDRQALANTAENGWLTMLAQEDAGGLALDLESAAVVLHAFGSALSGLPAAAAVAAFDAATRLAPLNGTPELADAAAGARLLLPAFATGPEAAVLSVEEHADGALTLNGKVRHVHGGAGAGLFLVEIPENGNSLAALVARDIPGLSIKVQRNVDGTSLVDLAFDNVKVPASHVAGDRAMATPVLARMKAAIAILTAAELGGLTDNAITVTLEHLRTREQFGRPLGQFQALQFRMADVHMQMSLSRALTFEAARLADTNSSSTSVTASAALAKAAEAAIAAARAMVQMHGAMGFTDEHDAGLHLKRALVLASAYGNAASHRAHVANQTADSGEATAIRFREDSADEAAFRKQVRTWLKENLPARLQHLPTRPSCEDATWWHKKLHERGWIAPSWPKKYGGMEASIGERIILFDELAAAGAPEISGQAIGHLGPILQKFGSEEQKARHLPGMVDGSVLWCQGYSEPSSGSDLASLRTRAVRDGDDFVINGQKIWTTWGHYADWMFALVRTNPDVKKQAGITFILIDMKTPGITPRPIHTITGEDEFAEVFFDDVRVPVSNVVGEIDGGWQVATALLEQERLNGANPMKAGQLLGKVKHAANKTGMISDPAFRDRLVRAEIDYVALGATYARIVRDTEKDARTNADYAFAKLIAAELQQELCELLVEALGPEGAVADRIDMGDSSVYPGLTYLQNRRATIYGGTVEIQRLLMARRVLRLT